MRRDQFTLPLPPLPPPCLLPLTLEKYNNTKTACIFMEGVRSIQKDFLISGGPRRPINQASDESFLSDWEEAKSKLRRPERPAPPPSSACRNFYEGRRDRVTGEEEGSSDSLQRSFQSQMSQIKSLPLTYPGLDGSFSLSV